MLDWSNTQGLISKVFTCGYCSNRVASDRGYSALNQVQGRAPLPAYLYICPECRSPSFFFNTGVMPGPLPGQPVRHLPQDIEKLYDEARRCTGASAYTAAVLLCRKLLMNIAVHEGAKEGESFLSYVTYLSDKGYVPPNGKGWVDHIRSKGNEATHEIHLMSLDDATELIDFSEMLLKFKFEFPTRVPVKTPKSPGP